MRFVSAILIGAVCLLSAPVKAACTGVRTLVTIDAPPIEFQMRRVPGLQVADAIGDRSGFKRSGGTFYNPIGTFTISFETQTDGLTSSCVAVTAVDYQLLDPTPEYWIAEELPQGSCIETELIAHELKHVAVFRRTYANFATEAHALIMAAIANYPVQTIPTYEERTKAEAKSAILEATNGLLGRLAQTAYKENLQVDHEGEYSRLRQTCSGELNKYLR